MADSNTTSGRLSKIDNPKRLASSSSSALWKLFPWINGGLAVVEQEGLIAAYSDEPNVAPHKTILDLTDKTVCCNAESGMFSAALDPQFEKFPFLYVYYRVASRHAYGENMPGLVSRLARFRVEDGRAVKDSELTILEAVHPRDHHYGGAIRFGSDGLLYLGIGYNTAQHEKAQLLDTLLGKIIRIDVRGATPEQPYRIPPDNPFVNDPEARPEIWAYGLRNPWRMDFAPDGRLFIADVGSGLQEEVSIAAAGDNLGWPLCGRQCLQRWNRGVRRWTHLADIRIRQRRRLRDYRGRNGAAVEQRLRVWRLLQRQSVASGTRRAGRLARARTDAGGTADIVFRH